MRWKRRVRERSLGDMPDEKSEAAHSRESLSRELQRFDDPTLVAAGLAFYQEERFDAARKTWEIVVERATSAVRAEAAYNLGILLTELGEISGARTAYGIAIESGTEQLAARASGNLGVILEGLGDLEGALAALERAAETDYDGRGLDAFHLGRVRDRLGDQEGAEAAYRFASHADPGYAARATLGLGDLFARLPGRARGRERLSSCDRRQRS